MYGSAKGRLPEGLDGLLTSQMTKAIEEANLGKLDKRIAERYLLDRVSQIDIAAEIGCERSTISRRLSGITPRVTRAASQIKIAQ